MPTKIVKKKQTLTSVPWSQNPQQIADRVGKTEFWSSGRVEPQELWPHTAEPLLHLPAYHLIAPAPGGSDKAAHFPENNHRMSVVLREV